MNDPLVRPLLSNRPVLLLGAWVSGNPDAYEYLIESIRRFPDQEEMKALIESVGFRDASYKNFSFGIACLYMGIKEMPE